jgi:DNA repair exonuclease SbcCD ATPase subunit
MQIIRLEAQNIKRLSAVSIEPNADASVVVLAGENEAGKSSVIDAIEMALAGDRVSPPEPIRRGRTKAKVVVDLGDMIVTRRYTDKGSSLVIENRDGLRYKSPQTLLDGFYNNLTFDPLAFAESKEQPTILRRLVGLDTSDLDDARKRFFEARTITNRDIARAKGALEKSEHYPDVTEPKDADVLIAQLAAADGLADVRNAAERQVISAGAVLQAATDRVTRNAAALDAARKALAAAEAEAQASADGLKVASDALTERIAERAASRSAVPDTTLLREALSSVQAHNRKVDANSRRAALARELQQYQAHAERLTSDIEDTDAEKASAWRRRRSRSTDSD